MRRAMRRAERREAHHRALRVAAVLHRIGSRARRLPASLRSRSAVASLLATLVDQARNAAGVGAAARNSASVLVLLHLVSPLLQTLQSRGTGGPRAGIRLSLRGGRRRTERHERDRENRCRCDHQFLHLIALQLTLHLASRSNMWPCPQLGADVGPHTGHAFDPAPAARPYTPSASNSATDALEFSWRATSSDSRKTRQRANGTCCAARQPGIAPSVQYRQHSGAEPTAG